MRDILQDVDRWLEEGQAVSLATVVQTWGSSPRRIGSKMAISAGGKISGSVSGGCVEAAVADAALRILEGEPPCLLHFGVADETAWQVGLACGGQIDVFVQPLDPTFYQAARQAWLEQRSFAMLTVIQGPPELLGQTLLARASQILAGNLGEVIQAAGLAACTAARETSRVELPMIAGQPVVAFIELAMPEPRLVMVGGVHITVALVALAKTLGYRTVVVDPRRAFGSSERFAGADQLVQRWPDIALGDLELDDQTAVAVLTHDPKLDDPALIKALVSPAFYVGALGSQQTQSKRRERLKQAGLSDSELVKLRGPIGIDLGAQTPEEIALAILAEIVAARHGKLVRGDFNTIG